MATRAASQTLPRKEKNYRWRGDVGIDVGQSGCQLLLCDTKIAALSFCYKTHTDNVILYLLKRCLQAQIAALLFSPPPLFPVLRG